MALEIKPVPTLEGEKALAFLKRIEKDKENKVSRAKTEKMKEAAQRILESSKR